MIGLPKGMTRDNAYIQGIADTEERISEWIKNNPFVKEERCYCDYLAIFEGKPKCRNCGHDNPHKYHDPEITSNNYIYCDASITTRMMGSEVKETILQYINEKLT